MVGFKVKNVEHYVKAFTHKSALKRYTLTESFETLEFIGASVLGFIITKFLFDRYENLQEGFLTKARTKLVRGKCLANIARKLKLHEWILMDEKGMRNGWNHNEKILEDVFEALVGAIYLDMGLLHTKEFVLNLYNNPEIVDLKCLTVDDNFKDQLMRYCQNSKWNLPSYVCSDSGEMFVVTVYINSQMVGVGTGKTKKQAEQVAAHESLKILGQI